MYIYLHSTRKLFKNKKIEGWRRFCESLSPVYAYRYFGKILDLNQLSILLHQVGTLPLPIELGHQFMYNKLAPSAPDFIITQ